MSARSRQLLRAPFVLAHLLAVIVISAPVGAADFRTLDFGARCDGVQAREQARGSVSIPWKKIPGSDVYAFRGRDFGRDLTLMYLCPKGALFSGNYLFPIEQLETAVTSYHNAYDLLVSIYGAPRFDNTQWQVGAKTKDPRNVNADPRKYMTYWKTSRLNVNMAMMRGYEPEGRGWRSRGWRVFLVLSGIKKFPDRRSD